MATDVETGATFTVPAAPPPFSPVRSGRISASGARPTRTSTRWTSTPSPRRAPTRSRSRARSRPSSPRFRIATGQNVYAGVHQLAQLLRQQRDGADFIPSALRTAAAHLNDTDGEDLSHAEREPERPLQGRPDSAGGRVDASGGWLDAGDYMKFVQTTSYTEDMLLAGVRDFPAQMGAGSRDLELHRRVAVRRAVPAAHVERQDLHAVLPGGDRSGNANTTGDHDIWRLPQADDTFGGTDPRYRYIRNRPVFRAAPPGAAVSPNLAGRDAAAFAECSQVFKTRDPEAREQVPAGRGAHLRPGRHVAERRPVDRDPVQLLSRDRVAQRHGARRHRAVLRTAAGGLPTGLPHTAVVLPGRCGALGLAVHAGARSTRPTR